MVVCGLFYLHSVPVFAEYTLLEFLQHHATPDQEVRNWPHAIHRAGYLKRVLCVAAMQAQQEETTQDEAAAPLLLRENTVDGR